MCELHRCMVHHLMHMILCVRAPKQVEIYAVEPAQETRYPLHSGYLYREFASNSTVHRFGLKRWMLQDEIKDQLGNEETQAGILLDLGRSDQAEEIYR